MSKPVAGRLKKIAVFLWKYVFFKSRLRDRLVFYFCVIAVMPLVMMGAVGMFTVNSTHNYDVSQLELQVLNQKIIEIEKFFGEILGILELRVSYDEDVEIDRQEQTFILQGLLKEKNAFEEVAFISLNGQETAKESRTERHTPLTNLSERSYFSKALQGNSYRGPVFLTRSFKPHMMLSAPVRNRNGSVIQVIAAELSLSPVQHIISQMQLGTLGFAYVVTPDGQLIAHSRLDVEATEKNMQSVPRVAAVLRGHTFTGFGKNDRYESSFSAVPVVGAGKKIPELGWGIFVEWPIAEADLVINNLKNQIIRFVILGLFGALLLSTIFAGSLIRPIRQLEAFAKEVGKGNLKKRIQLKTGDELEELGITLNLMTKGLMEFKNLKDEFVFIAAHEIQAPVTIIKGYLSLISGGIAGSVSSELKTHLDSIKEANDRLIQLINDLLEIARSEAGRIKVNCEAISLQDAIMLITNQVAVNAKEKGVLLRYDPSAPLPLVSADTEKLKAVILNLVSNAIKYNRPKDGEVIITHEIKKNTVVTHVSDNGIGIPKEHQKHLFEKFYRVKTEQTIEISGTGLGLFIVKESLERMKGRIWFTSAEGKGSTFSFELQKA